jgi:uncharacterized protein (UPF0335 family)
MTGAIAKDRLKSFVDRIERLEEEKSQLGADIREIYAEAKGAGFDVKTIRKVVKERKINRMDRAEQLEMFDLYWNALDMPKDHQNKMAA